MEIEATESSMLIGMRLHFKYFHSIALFGSMFIALTVVVIRLLYGLYNVPSCLGQPYIYATVHHEKKNILKYSRDGCLLSTEVVRSNSLNYGSELRSMAMGKYRGTKALFLSDASDHASQIIIFEECSKTEGHDGKWCEVDLAVTKATNPAIDHSYGICFDNDDNLYVSSQHSNSVLRFYADSFSPMPVNPTLVSTNHMRYYDGTFVQFGEPGQHETGGRGVRSIIHIDGHIWIANEGLEGIIVASVATGQLVALIPVHCPIGLHYDKARNVVYVGSKSNAFGGMVLVIDVQTHEIQKDAFLSHGLYHPAGITSHENVLYVAEQTTYSILAFDLDTRAFISTIVASIPGEVETLLLVYEKDEEEDGGGGGGGTP